jgi:hypothetical protein
MGASGPKVTCLFGLFGETGSSILIWFNKKKEREKGSERKDRFYFIFITFLGQEKYNVTRHKNH